MSDPDFYSNLICSQCSNIKMLGINFENKNPYLKDNTHIYSYCIYNHLKNSNLIDNISLDNLFISSTSNNDMICELDIKCDYCKEDKIKYHCLECKRSVCKNCFQYHKTHNFYNNENYISDSELEKIKTDFDKSKNVVKI